MMILSFILWISIGVATGYLAGQRGRDPVIWFMIGILLGIFGLLLLLVMPPVDQDLEEEKKEDEDLTMPDLPPNAHPHDSYLIRDWFYLDASHHQQGPVSYFQLRQEWQEGKVNQNSFVWCEDMAEWQRINQLAELESALLKD